MIKSGDVLYEVIGAIYEKHKDRPFISPNLLATEGMKKINFKPRLHELGWIGCHLQLRQIARSFCRQKFDPASPETADPDNDLFPETLQERYPMRPIAGEEPTYVLRSMLSDEDRAWNVSRMRRGANSLTNHADALEAEGRTLARARAKTPALQAALP